MANKRKIEIFSADCPSCQQTVNLVNSIVCNSCEVDVLDMHDKAVFERAKKLGIHRVPAIVIDGKLADCCAVSAPDERSLRVAGIGQSI